MTLKNQIFEAYDAAGAYTEDIRRYTTAWSDGYLQIEQEAKAGFLDVPRLGSDHPRIEPRDYMGAESRRWGTAAAFFVSAGSRAAPLNGLAISSYCRKIRQFVIGTRGRNLL